MVGIVGTNYKPFDNTYQIKEALITVLMIAYIQPFEDGNKRTSRILGNAILLASG